MTEETCLHRRRICSGMPCRYFDDPCRLERNEWSLFSEARSCYCGFLHSDLRVHFNPVQLTVCGTVLCVEKKKTRYAILSCPSAIAFFVDVLVCNSSPTSQVLRGSSPFNCRFRIVLYLTRVSLDCNIKCMHSTF